MSGLQPLVFISAVTSELGEARVRLAKVLEEHGANVVVEHEYHNRLADGTAIQRTIEQADLVICLIGNQYGAELPKINRPPEAQPGCSWTQWEYLYARSRAKELRLFLFNGPKPTKQSKTFTDRQDRFRKRLTKTEMGTFGGKFFRRFDNVEQLEKDITQYLVHLDGALAKFRAGTWARIRAKYRSNAAQAWDADFQRVYYGKIRTPAAERAKLMAAHHAPFIASQRFSILEPKNGRQLHALRPAAFLPGRSSETEAIAREDSTWNPVARDALKQALLSGKPGPLELGGVYIPYPIRLFLVSGGGIGKTTNMRWLDATLNASEVAVETPGRLDRRDADPEADGNDYAGDNATDPETAIDAVPRDILAIRINAGTIINKNDDEVLKELTAQIAARVGEANSVWSSEAIANGLVEDARAYRLVILIDGLDHVGTGKIPFLLSIQSDAPERRWSRCCVIAAGRPHAIQGWRDGIAGSEDAVAVGRWRFLEPSEFDSDEAEVYLGITEGKSRHGLVAYQLGSLARVPRVLEYVRTLTEKRLEGVRTSADIYERSLRELIKRTLKAGGKETRMIGPRWQEDCERDEPPARQVQHIMKLLSALAFLSLCPATESDASPDAPAKQREAFRMTISEDVRGFIRERIGEDRQRLYEVENLERDFQAMAGFASILGNGVLDATDTDAETFNSLVWSNRTIQQFLAAYWLAIHAGGFDALVARQLGKAIDIPPEHPLRDAERLRHYVFYPEDTRADATYELNMFLAEMPPSTPLNPSSWVASASAWYNPDLRLAPSADAAPARKWSTEMLYRSWATMHDIAGYAFDDWWDLPYESLVANPPGRARAAASLHSRRDSGGLDQNPAARRAARTILDDFYSDFGNILAGSRGPQQQAAARDMMEEQNWLAVPGGSFEMGAPEAEQGFPPKVKAYWLRDLDEVQTGQKPAEAVARRSTKREWFTGAQGRQLREDDILWLTDTFRALEPPPDAPRLAVADRNAPDYQRTLQILEQKWSRRDETPAENPQQIAPFAMHRLPILHRWYDLFAPGHHRTVASYLKPTPHPPDDHPAIYISWFDAWAFCQWANWVEDGPAAEGGRRRYGLRLPHESEWEYAARWRANGAGQPEPAPYGQRYWWGDEFYRHEDSAEPEPLSNELAHAIGTPGHTRAPHEAAANGLGFRDILGNVWEWTANVYEMRREGDNKGDEAMKYSRAYPADRPPVNCLRTMRGGLWYYLDLLANCTARFRLSSDDRDYKMGFRVVREERSPQ
jgi:formylglycine-generating enzyme required for sulfatase activity